MEEERRLCYVAMTRAQERLVMTNARQRMLYGRTNSNLPSRFLEELPQEPVDWQNKTEQRPSGASLPDEAGLGGSSFAAHQPGGNHGPGLSRSRRQPRPVRDPGFTAPKPVQAADLLQLEKGDAIRHRTFGQGMVLSVRPMGNDALVEVAFDGVGTKKLMLRAAGVHITKLGS